MKAIDALKKLEKEAGFALITSGERAYFILGFLSAQIQKTERLVEKEESEEKERSK